jgi:[ribosomal protein S5]-alanine N-acetyltransferase
VVDIVIPVETYTPRLYLRAFRRADHAAVHAYASDPLVCRYMDWGPNTIEDTAAFLDAVLFTARSDYPLAIVDRTDGELIGAVELRVTSAPSRRGELGYVLARARWGQGYATEAAAAVLAFGFERLGLHKVSATCDPANVASARVLEKIGLIREGYLREHLLIRGEWRDRLLFAALAPGRHPLPCDRASRGTSPRHS